MDRRLLQLITSKKIVGFWVAILFLFFQTVCLGDSTAIAPTPIQTAPGSAGIFVPYISCGIGQRNDNNGTNFPTSCAWPLQTADQCFSAIGSTINAGVCPSRSGSNYDGNSPYQTTNGSSDHVTIAADGMYEIMANFVITQKSLGAVYYWIDDWAYNADYQNSSLGQHTRVFYSGDVPYILNVGLNGSVYTVRFSGTVHLKAGSSVYFPRIWSDCPDSNNCGALLFTNWFGNCTNTNWYTNATCFYITLLSSP